MVAEKNNIIPFDALLESIEGELFTDNISKTIYATDASVYQELPLGVVYPKSNDDLKSIVQFAAQHRVALIPRAGGTSLAGQCVGSGLVVDVSRYLDKIISFDTEKQEITVQPGIIRDQVNFFLQSHDLFFAPITSTANRATIGGMVGNNSCGTNSIVYGNTRKYVKSVKALLSDGSEVVFGDLTKAQFEVKMDFPNLEGQLYRHIYEILSKKEIRQQIIDNFPKKNIHRRNTGYALDELMSCDIFTNNEQPFNFCKLIAGSEGTLVLMTEITIKLCPLPPKKSAVLICHFHTIQSCLGAVKHAMTHQPFFCEMMDKTVLDCTKANIKYRKSMTMFEGEPQGVLLVEFRNETTEAAIKQAEELQKDLTTRGFGYDFNIITNEKTKEIWQLRSAGLGLLANIPGDAKAVACIEDTSVAIEDLADYIQEFTEMMKEFGQDVVYYAHAGAGELHLRPKLDLKQAADQEKFYKISFESAKLVKKYGGSLSGEHGDGRVRAPFIPLVVGEKTINYLKTLKQLGILTIYSILTKSYSPNP